MQVNMEKSGQGPSRTTMDRLAQAYGAQEAEPPPKPGRDLLAQSDWPHWPTFGEIAGVIPDSPAKESLVRLRAMIRRYPLRVAQYPNPGIKGGVLLKIEAEPKWAEANRDKWQEARRLLGPSPDMAWWLIVEHYLFGIPRAGTGGQL